MGVRQLHAEFRAIESEPFGLSSGLLAYHHALNATLGNNGLPQAVWPAMLYVFPSKRATLSEMAEAMDLPETTALRMLTVLRDAQLLAVIRGEQRARFALTHEGREFVRRLLERVRPALENGPARL